MPRLSSDRTYGLVIIVVMVLSGVWLAYDAQASIYHPGWFAGWRSNVWCKTIVYGPEFGTGTFFHYPGKKLPRVMKELGVPLQIRTLYLNAERQETVCVESWKEAASQNARLQGLTQEYREVLAHWVEEDYRRAVLLLNLQRNGMEQLTALLELQQRKLDQSQQK